MKSLFKNLSMLYCHFRKHIILFYPEANRKLALSYDNVLGIRPHIMHELI